MATLSEHESKLLLQEYGIPVTSDELAHDVETAVAAADRIGYPVVAKLCGDRIPHKTERGLVRLALADADAVRVAAADLVSLSRPDDGDVAVLIAPMVIGARELAVGLHRDPLFGAVIMLAIGGIFAEALADVVFRLVPIDSVDADEMIDDLSMQTLIGEFRGEPAVDRTALASVLLGLSELAIDRPNVVAADINPLIVTKTGLMAVDSLVELA